MPVFNFPVPGRRQKKAPPPPIPTTLTKAQKILGANQLNVDSPTLPRDPSRVWETASTSGRSIAISERSIAYDDGDNGLQSLTEGEVVHPKGLGKGNIRYEESSIIPRNLTNGNRRASQADESLILGAAPLPPSLTDASSLRRQQSSSTITSFYDKANVPLVISQQTSSSVMAKGLPLKASSLLDIDGTRSEAAQKRKKPSKLDLSLLLPGKSRSPTSASSSKRGGFLSADMMLRSPSSASTTTPAESTPPPIKQRSDKKLLKKSSKKSLRDNRPQSPLKSSNMLPPMKENDRLHDLYDHYEQMSFHNMMKKEHRGSIGSIPSESQPPHPATRLRTPTTRSPTATSPFSLSPRPAQGPLRPTSSKIAPSKNLGAVDTTTANALGFQISLSSPKTDCAASISSRHTRTSKASKQTNPSLVDLDLQQSSVLSLSSDSEDDFESISKTSLSAPRSPSDAPSSPDSRRPAASPVDPAPSIKAPRPGYPRLSSNRYLDIPEQPPPPTRQLPTINPRTSSASLSSTATIKGTHFPMPSSASRSPSRMSRSTTPTTSGYATPSTASTINDSRQITMIPSGLSHSQPHNRSSDQPTPPLSPSSVDFFLRSNHNSVLDGDQGSIRSSRSLGAPNSNRFMAVTRQEELLLAALRQKRARMRESIIAEFEEGHSSLQTDDVESQHLMRRLGKELDQQDMALRPATSGQYEQTPGYRASKASSGLVSFSDFPMAMQKVTGIGGAQHDNVVYLSRPPKSMGSPASKHANGADVNSGLSDYLDFDDSGLGTGTGTGSGSSDEGSMRPGSERSSARKRVARIDHDMALKSHRASRRASSRADTVSSRIASVSPAPGPPLRRIRENGARESAIGVPRPDSPVEGMDQPRQALPRKKAVRISAVGMVGSEAGWWDDEG